MNRERLDERRAKVIVERELNVSLDHADKNGGADYRSRDGQVAVEVTRATNEEVVKGRRASGATALSKVAGESARCGLKAGFSTAGPACPA